METSSKKEYRWDSRGRSPKDELIVEISSKKEYREVDHQKSYGRIRTNHRKRNIVGTREVCRRKCFRRIRIYRSNIVIRLNIAGTRSLKEFRKNSNLSLKYRRNSRDLSPKKFWKNSNLSLNHRRKEEYRWRLERSIAERVLVEFESIVNHRHSSQHRRKFHKNSNLSLKHRRKRNIVSTRQRISKEFESIVETSSKKEYRQYSRKNFG